MTQDRRITDKLPGQPLQWDDNAAPAASPAAAPAAGQAELAKLERFGFCDIDGDNFITRPDGNYIRYIDAQALFAAPVAADTEQATIDTPEFRKLANAWGRHWSKLDAWDKLVAYIDAAMGAAPLATPADAGAGLTDERIKELANANRGPNGVLIKDISFARAIEREVLAHLSTPGAQVTAPNIDKPEFRDMLFRFAREAMPTEEIIAYVQRRFDAYAQGVAAATEYLHAELEKARAAVGQSPAPVTAEPVTGLQADIDSIADEMEAEALNYEGDFADTVKGCAEALRQIAERATPAPADRDAIRDQALAGVPKYELGECCVIGGYSDLVPAADGYVYKVSEVEAALKSMERAADAKGGQQ